MKSVFYIGAALMIGAGIYGFVDYKKANQTKEFNSLYDEKEIKDLKPRNADGVEWKVPMKMASTAVLPPKEETKPAAKTATKKQKAKKKKRFTTKSFSRAAMVEYVPEELLDKPAPEEITEKIEQ